MGASGWPARSRRATWLQVLALTISPALLDHPKVGDIFPSDAIARAKQLLKYFPGGLGAYSDSRGSEGVRKEIAEFITQRDGYPSDPNVRMFLPPFRPLHACLESVAYLQPPCPM
jgi:aspartate/methionine/tyrosine aminotransferase